MRHALLLAFGLAASSCASTAVQTEAILKGPRDVPAYAHVSQVPFTQQTKHYCGPATLKMAMDWAGHEMPLEKVGEEVYTPGKNGSLQMDMISAARREGLMAMQIQGLENLLKELAAGHPVIVLENLAFRWYPWYHYSVALGYDLAEPAIILHSGSKQDWHYSMRKFERNWKFADYWGLVVLPPGELSASASDLEHCAAAAGLEQLGMTEKAARAYHAILERWPESFGALIGMGNIEYGRRNFSESVGYLERATKAFPFSAAAWHNRAIAEGAAGKRAAAERSTRKAMELVIPSEQAGYRESLKEWMPRMPERAANVTGA